jgi:hypothetical protein
MTKEETREYNRAYRIANKDRIAAQKKQWALDNPDKVKACIERNKDNALAQKREWNRNNKELKAAIDKKYREANKEKLSAKKKLYREANKDIISAKKKAEYQANREKYILKSQKRQESLKDGKITMYYLPEHHYVGVTNSIDLRMKGHRSSHNRYTDDVEIICKFDTREEAIHYERILHSIGYRGADFVKD